MGSAALRVLVVDDEPLARRRLLRLLERQGGISAQECANGQQAVEWLFAHDADLVLLDVQMPGVSGFDVIDMVGAQRMPPVVFVTAFDRYAVHAFRVNAVDYLLKPFDAARLQLALDRARQRRAHETSDQTVTRLTQVLRDLTSRRDKPDRLLVKRTGAMDFVRIDAIDWVEAQGNYAALHVGTQVHLVRETLTRLEERLDPRQFVRVRRTAIVNVDRIERLAPWQKDEHVIRLQAGVQIAVSRGFIDRLEKALAAFRL